MAREIRATVEFVGEPGKAEINAFARAIVPLLKERAEEIVANVQCAGEPGGV